MKVDRLFDVRLKALTPDDAAVATAVERAERVARIIKNDGTLAVLESQLGGSCAKKTALAPVKDVDLFLYLDRNAWQKTDGSNYSPQTVLRDFEVRLRRTFRRHIESRDIIIRRQDHSLRIRYLREGSIHIDVVPALWDGNKAYLVDIPERSTKRWVKTCIPRQHLLLERLDAPNRYLRRAIRLLKHWRNVHKLNLRSYALEILAAHAVARRVDTAHARAVFVSVLEWIAETALNEPVYLLHYVQASEYRFGRRPVIIMDPAVPSNNVAATAGKSDRVRIVAAARHASGAIGRAERSLQRAAVRDANSLFRSAFVRRTSRPKERTPPPQQEDTAKTQPVKKKQWWSFWD